MLQSRDSIAEQVALEVKAQKGFGHVQFGVWGRKGSSLWKGCLGQRLEVKSYFPKGQIPKLLSRVA